MEKYQKAIFQEIDAYMASTHVWEKQPKRSNQPADDFFHDFRNRAFENLWATVRLTSAHVRYSFYLLDGEKETYIIQTAQSQENSPKDIAREISYIAEAIHATMELKV